MMHQIAHTAAATLNNSFGIGTLGLMLVTVPIIGMDLVHKIIGSTGNHLTKSTNNSIIESADEV